MAGGCSWTPNWLQFDNSYFRCGGEDDELLWLPTDKALKECPELRPHFMKYAVDQEAFFRDYAAAHRKISDCGARFHPSQGLELQ